MSTISQYLQQLITEGGNENFLVINLKGDAYIQFAAEKGKQAIYCEVSGSNPKINFHLNQTQIDRLTSLNWSLADSHYHNNYCQTVVIKDVADIASLEQLIHATATIFNTSEEAYSYRINLQ